MPILLFDRYAILLAIAAGVVIAAFIREASREKPGRWMGLYCVVGLFLAISSASYAMGMGERHHRLVTMRSDLRQYCAKHHCQIISINPERLTARVKLSAGCKVNAYIFGEQKLGAQNKWALMLPGPADECLPGSP